MKGESLRTSARSTRFAVGAAALAGCLALAIPGLASAGRNAPVSAAALTGVTGARAAVLSHNGTLHPADSWGSSAKCYGLIPFSGYDSYKGNCYGHDEP